ncbi:MAG: glycosyltransferase [Saprospiraceae bacterium]|nr:glycosyltransferase [Saprospiraceae bacterium]
MENSLLRPIVGANPMLVSAEPTTLVVDHTTSVTNQKMADSPKPTMYIIILATWLASVVWFQPRLLQLLDMADNLTGKVALGIFIVFINFAWLYGIYNLGVVAFAAWYQWFGKKKNPIGTLSETARRTTKQPPVAILYTTCNDFVEASVVSCVEQDYKNFKVYILDDSSQEAFKQEVDQFAARYPELVQVVRRPDRKDFKAGNMNYALEHVVTLEKYFAVADADEILPPDFLTKTVEVLENDSTCGFVQANHRSNPNSDSPLAKSLGVGVDIHWQWYQPLRNEYGFVMFLGHGALLRRDVWAKIGGFPGIVSEDLGFAIHARELGYRGRFLEEVICYEDFPDSVRAFRIRHMKWTRGTSEFLKKKMAWLIKSRNISWPEKLDILFPTLNLPLTLLYLLFMLNANLVLPYLFGQTQDVTFVLGNQEMTIPIVVLDPDFQVIYGWDFYLITLLTFFSPVLSFILAMARQPLKLYRFLSHSTVMYAALTPLSSVGVLAYMISGKATFIVTGDKKQADDQPQRAYATWSGRMRNQVQQLLHKSHPDTGIVQVIEVAFGVLFGIAAIYMFQISFIGLCLAFLMMPLMHHLKWEHKLVRVLAYVPFALILLGVALSGLSVFGMKAVFFGYGFHF